MKIDELPSYQVIIKELKKKNRLKHLLIGNGFSMSYDDKIFSYNALSNYLERADDQVVLNLFKRLNTKNFEQIMEQLDNFCQIADLFSDDKNIISRISAASEKLKSNLVDAVKELHPEHVFTIPENKSSSCSRIFQEYLDFKGSIFSSNYDLLPYWVLMRHNKITANDGFGRELQTDLDRGEDVDSNTIEFSELRWGKNKDLQNIFYLHGSLPIFDDGINIVKLESDSQHFLLEKIKNKIKNKQYPVFVTAGDGREKLTHIMHNKYLSFCYEKLSSIHGSLVTFGFSFGDSDTHIIDAINAASKKSFKAPNKLLSIYIGVFSENDLNHISKINFNCAVRYFDARTTNIWLS